ncbi:MAG TPA: zinc ribbon domain-containing protein [Victivallales bacterium]|nr:zinc ribbon domain-containing protein [Victivallales bacterium]HRR28363.1 zinc ribbon domain-containing protein [Victivallales bacterium]
MPIFEFKCKNCGKIFEKICKINDKVSDCPDCGKEANKILSAFNAIGMSPFSKCSSAETCPSAAKSCCSSVCSHKHS